MKKIVLGMFVVLFTATAFAQSKVGTVDADFILTKMPELTGANEKVKAYNLDLETQMKAKIQDYEAKVKLYQSGQATFTDADKKTKQGEIIALEEDISKFRQNGAQLLQLKQSEVVQPLYKKIGEMVTVVAKEQGYSHILTIGNNNNFAYADPAADITMAVLAKLGITVEE
ncbi:OmpH family outer membrane protein [uncultured Dokdonia sp.]|jgi:outer membrane protein|uniref:OmpH family outer membrane protein n=1 Tax=unclassified Dokdonia TaxID=2615033 RepID=UPI00260E1B19|nr:OmpH family outer membrane protein [uncultured Dokdonia sp.]|tara:strand:- start:116136 stop:116648 length:513 start_codon:yes stop_codon:yes gene_type:complete